VEWERRHLSRWLVCWRLGCGVALRFPPLQPRRSIHPQQSGREVQWRERGILAAVHRHQWREWLSQDCGPQLLGVEKGCARLHLSKVWHGGGGGGPNQYSSSGHVRRRQGGGLGVRKGAEVFLGDRMGSWGMQAHRKRGKDAHSPYQRRRVAQSGRRGASVRENFALNLDGSRQRRIIFPGGWVAGTQASVLWGCARKAAQAPVGAKGRVAVRENSNGDVHGRPQSGAAKHPFLPLPRRWSPGLGVVTG
jgi:hypothetical protein